MTIRIHVGAAHLLLARLDLEPKSFPKRVQRSVRKTRQEYRRLAP
jgi:hypothetical protein